MRTEPLHPNCVIALYNQVGSYRPKRENFRLTAEVKRKSTKKLRFDPREFCGRADWGMVWKN
jgi:hypothetical protein